MTCLAFLIFILSTQSGDQMPPIGIIDFYGLRNVSESQAREALRIKEGDLLRDNYDQARQRLEALPVVAEARIRPICCHEGKTILYVGVREKGTRALRFRQAPRGKARLPRYIVEAGEALSKALREAVLKGNAGEDFPEGHSLAHDPSARAIQESFVKVAASETSRLRDVLHNSADPQHRALAAEVLAYARNKKDVVADLVKAVRDPDEGVRNNSIRALGLIAQFALQKPDSGILIDPQPFIDLINSVEWYDRNKAALVLSHLTARRDASILESLRHNALQSLAEMARWKSQGHAFAPFFILGRVGGFSEDELFSAWSRGDREALIEAALKRSKSN